MERLGRRALGLFLVGVCVCTLVHAQGGTDSAAAESETKTGEAKYAWSDEGTYRPPDFEAYFPDSPEGAGDLARWWATENTASTDAEEALGIVRRGLRRYDDTTLPILRWVGNAFIWGKEPQHAGAIELMYHAAACSRPYAGAYSTRSAAIYFGLSVVRPKSDAILRTLVDLCMLVNDPNDLSRIAWGVGAQRAAALRFLESHLRDDNPVTREKAEVVRKILNRELKAFVWAQERKRAAAQASYGGSLDELGQTLWSGASSERKVALELIAGKDITLIMDDGFVADFEQCATDPDPAIRRQVARLVGQRWVWSLPEQNPDAIALLLALSEDSDRGVRYDAVYYGLSTVREKGTKVIRRLLQIAFFDREPNIYRRIVWGLRGDHEQVRELLDADIADAAPATANAAREVYDDMVGAE